MKKRPNSADLFRVSIEGPAVWLWYVGAIRVGVLLFMALGAYILMDDASSFRLGLLNSSAALPAVIRRMWCGSTGSPWANGRRAGHS